MADIRTKYGTEVRLPTSLRAWDSIKRNTTFSGRVQLIAAIDMEETTRTMPSILKYTLTHGNIATHAKPVLSSTYATSIDGTIVDHSYDVHVNDGFRCISNYRDDDEQRGGRGTKACTYIYTTEKGEWISVSNSLTWYKSGDVYTSYTLSLTTELTQAVLLPNGRVRTYNHRWKYALSGKNAGSLPRFDHYQEFAGTYSQLATGSRNTSALSMSWPDFDQYHASKFFCLHEPFFIWDGGERPEIVQTLQTLAFQNAFDQVPSAADNNIANMLEMGEFVIDALRPDAWPNLVSGLAKKVRGLKSSSKEVAKAVGNLWLMYRYAYSTTKSDTKQALDYIGRKAVTYYTPLTFNGQASRYSAVAEADIVCRVKFDLVLNGSNMLGMLHHYDQMVGLNLSAYKLWDLIPFSFVVDWFFDIGGVLEDQEMKNSYSDYIFSNYWWSLKYTTEVFDPLIVGVYSRWSQAWVPDTVIHAYNSSGGKTWLKRLGDTVALVGGAF